MLLNFDVLDIEGFFLGLLCSIQFNLTATEQVTEVKSLIQSIISAQTTLANAEHVKLNVLVLLFNIAKAHAVRLELILGKDHFVVSIYKRYYYCGFISCV